MRRGATLPELIVILTLLGMAGTAITAGVRRQGDRARVVGAREALVGLLVRTRGEALARGGAVLGLDARSGLARVLAEDSVLATVDLLAEYGVTLDLGGAPAARLSFDGLGLGRAASRTLRLSRGREEATLVVAAHGRVLRR